jgi:hypothetical protein
MDALRRHFKFAMRQLWRNPGFTATVILTLALSIGANTDLFHRQCAHVDQSALLAS